MEMLYWQSNRFTFQSRKGDRNTIIRNRKLHDIAEKRIDLVHFQNIGGALCS